ncbi:MAG TPA: DUF4412 domain-containing protein [Bacteroidales bacterium]|nr:DUF4412 domain-containing protein [Bacteroidales bacterium]
MKTKAIILTFAVMVAMPAALNGQGLLRRAINRHIEQKIDSAVDKSLENKEKDQAKDSNANADNTANKDYSTRATGRGLFGGKIDIKYDDDYKFTGRIYMQMESYDNKNVVKSDYYTYFNKSNMNAGIEMEVIDQSKGEKPVPTVFIFDGENRCFIMLIGGEDSKTGIISTLPTDSAMAAMAEKHKGEDPEHAQISKTGNTRMIAGYKCEEYKVTDPEDNSYANVWMTKDIKLNADRAYWSKAGVPTYYNFPGFEGAIMLAMESYDKHNKPVMKMETKEIDENYNHDISTSGYTFMKMNFGQAGKK